MSCCPSIERRIAILGATGSIGRATVEVITHLNRCDEAAAWRVHGISGHRNVGLLAEIAQQTSASRIVLSAATDSPNLSLFPSATSVQSGPEQLAELAADPVVDIVVAAIVGRAGLESTLAAVRAGKRLAIANKETLVVAGGLVRQAATASGAELLPVDSEHSAIFQCLAAGGPARRIILTASGGPFHHWSLRQMHGATIDQALDHPTWQMGRKITIDSATMMNKALEIVEACWLFDCPADQIAVMIHRQSVVHSMVELVDGSTIAQLSPPDMKLPIQYALTYPRRLPGLSPPLALSEAHDWTLEPVDEDRFPAIPLGFEVARSAGTAGAVVNAANEEAVGLFLQGRIRFTDIVPACRIALENHHHEHNVSLQRLLELDRWARAEVHRWQARSN